MLAVVKEHLGPGFSVKEVPYPVLRDTDVIIKVRSVGICGSDGPILAGTPAGALSPHPRPRVLRRRGGSGQGGEEPEGGGPGHPLHRHRLRGLRHVHRGQGGPL